MVWRENQSSNTKACTRSTDGPNLNSVITLQATQHHQSIRKIQSSAYFGDCERLFRFIPNTLASTFSLSLFLL